jgi:hypothetical protein
MVGIVLIVVLASGCMLGRYEVVGNPTRHSNERVLRRSIAVEGAIQGDILRLEATEKEDVEVQQVEVTAHSVYSAGTYDQQWIADTVGYFLVLSFVVKPYMAVKAGIFAASDDKAYIIGGPLGVLLAFLPGFWITDTPPGDSERFDHCASDSKPPLTRSNVEKVTGATRILRSSAYAGPMSVECNGIVVNVESDSTGIAEMWVSKLFGVEARKLLGDRAVDVTCKGERVRVKVVDGK